MNVMRKHYSNYSEGVLIHENGKAVYCNNKFLQYIKIVDAKQLIGNNIIDIVHPNYQKRVISRINKVVQKKVSNNPEKQILINSDGNAFEAIVKSEPLFINGGKFVITFFRNNSKHNEIYGNLISTDSAGLLNELLINITEIRNYFEYYSQIHQTENDIKKNLVKNWRYNFFEVIKPLINKLKTTQLNKEQLVYLNMIERLIVNGMVNLTFIKSLPPDFTQQEIQIASLINADKSTKEIADLLNISERTIVFHRSNIRRKLGIKERSVRLNKHLSCPE